MQLLRELAYDSLWLAYRFTHNIADGFFELAQRVEPFEGCIGQEQQVSTGPALLLSDIGDTSEYVNQPIEEYAAGGGGGGHFSVTSAPANKTFAPGGYVTVIGGGGKGGSGGAAGGLPDDGGMAGPAGKLAPLNPKPVSGAGGQGAEIPPDEWTDSFTYENVRGAGRPSERPVSGKTGTLLTGIRNWLEGSRGAKAVEPDPDDSPAA